jgi:hypothetical protein
MSGSHKTDDLVNDMLADMCGLIVKTIALIPPDLGVIKATCIGNRTLIPSANY